MVKPRNRKKISFSDRRPEFFKVYLRQLSSQRMRIPPAFIEHFNGTIPNKAVLKDLAGKSCHVEVEEVENGVFIDKGWQGFVSDHSIEHGDFLIFRYNGNSLFEVRIFGKDGCKKEQATVTDKPIACVKKEEETEEAKQTQQETRTKQEPGPAWNKPMCFCKRRISEIGQKIEKSGSVEVCRYHSTRIALLNAEVHRMFEAAELDLPKNPCFVGSLAMRYNLNIPRLAVIGNNINLKPDIVIRKKNGKSWPVKVIFRNDGRIGITTGWVDFLKDNKLGKKDKCVFEFIVGRGGICKELQAHMFYAEARGQMFRRHWATKRP